ncbi:MULTISPECIES: peroxiredoxin-like family protein [unclassified Roseofilum]|uniref:peroxiredoxin-like family protein n=1 Tax=unclassified Roseofilum TaxID=2620099 RepID=UPI000E9B38C7|nr:MULTISPECIES: peroxiredoxin-like family protein [unclassified Roseofilum]MBP0007216.1 AhpC/TSA family protein [Roseofilum sp. Belize Diploria]MBP0031859.1 AhpC/TSA family protein [Roseofilum sp. Belize BBD 4]HBQ97545.1 alkyl hydroperoxide reductase [Cyanobacteria bacterium UBA11691]
MTLANDLNAHKQQFRSNVPQETQNVMQQATTDLGDSGILEQTLKVGDTIPDFTLPNATGKPVNVKELLTKGPVAIAFYRGGWCPYCNLELKALQNALASIEETGATLVAISPETPDNSLTTQEKNELAFPVLSDVDNQIARQFGLVFKLPASLLPIYQSFGIDVAAHNGNDHFELPIPATYVVQPNGKIVYAFADVDYTKRAEPSAIVDALKGL